MDPREREALGDGDLSPSPISLEAVRGQSSPDGLVLPGGEVLEAQKFEILGRLVAGIAHEFSNALTVIIGVADHRAEMLARDDPSRRDLEEIRRAGERAAVLTRRLLEFARPGMAEAGVLDACAHVKGAEQLLRSVIGENVILWTRFAAPNPRVRIAPVHLEVVLLELAAGARESIPGGGSLSIDCSNTTDSAGNWLEIRFLATAAGASPNAPGPGSRTRAQEDPARSSGPGLASSRSILAAAGGLLRPERGPGGGARFIVTLPLVQAGAPDPAAEPVHASAASGSAESVLIVERNTEVRGWCAEVLRSHGYQVLCAAGGEEAIVEANRQAGRLSLVLLDAAQHDSGGRHLLATLRERNRGLRALYLGGYNGGADQDGDARPIPELCVGKPFAPSVLVSGIRQALARSAAHPDVGWPGPGGDRP